jgi:histone H3/H4
MKHIPKAAIERLIREEAGSQRVSADLVEEIGNILEASAKKLAKKAVLVAIFQRVVTVKAQHLHTALDMEKAQRK